MCCRPSSLTSFFFYSYVHHRDLHSFPTRRSSDLVREELDEVVNRPGWSDFRKDRGAAPSLLAVFPVEKLDRKSTRLNSSHLDISYAVFCLKKKKKQERTVYISC